MPQLESVNTAGRERTTAGSVGIAAGLFAHLFWGASVLFWPLLDDLPAVSILAHRMMWTCAFMLLVLLSTKRWGEVKTAFARSKTIRLLLFCAFLLAGNWGLFLWAVNSGRVIETSLGYYITPLLNVLMGRLLLGERMTRAQGMGILLAVAGVAWGLIVYGHFSWLSLVLASTFAIYGYMQKTISVEAAPSLFIETLFLTPMCIIWLLVMHPGNFGTLIGHGPGRTMLLLSTVFFTAVPLLTFSFAARHVTLTTIGVLQFVSPSINFLLAVFAMGEQVKPSDFVTFPLIWLALAIYTWDAIRRMQSLRHKVNIMDTDKGRK